MDVSIQQPSFERLAAELSPSLSRYLRRYVGDPATADDLLQETLIRIAQGLPGFEGRSATKTWAFAIATRVAADHFRSPVQRLGIVDVEEADEVPDPGRLIDEQIVVDEMNTCIRQVIDSLPADYRAAVVLHDLEGLTAAQIAEICAASVATVKIRIHRARKRLKQALNRQCDFFHDSENVFRCHRRS